MGAFHKAIWKRNISAESLQLFAGIALIAKESGRTTGTLGIASTVCFGEPSAGHCRAVSAANERFVQGLYQLRDDIRSDWHAIFMDRLPAREAVDTRGDWEVHVAELSARCCWWPGTG